MKAVKFILVFALTFLVGVFLSPVLGIGLATGGALAVGLALIPKPVGVFAGITPEIWQDFIENNIFRGSEFITNSIDASQFVLAGSVVHIPQAGTGIGAKKNRKSLPATITNRKDVDVVYVLDEFTTDPTLIKNAEQVELSYDKMESVIGEHVGLLGQIIGDWFAYLWASNENIVRTSGESVPAHLDGATGNRKKVTVADIRAVKKLMNKQNTVRADRFGLLDTDMMDQLIADVSATNAKDFSVLYDAPEGRIIKLESFTLIERSLVTMYTNETKPKKRIPFADDITYTKANATDNAGAIFWQKNAVERALGDTLFFENKGDATFYGDIYSALQRAGGRIRRAKEEGAIALVQAAA